MKKLWLITFNLEAAVEPHVIGPWLRVDKMRVSKA